jgi:2-polyprenyl-6-methoxyphenol hydroxylase-like FAD-dependent oxidoreductase
MNLADLRILVIGGGFSGLAAGIVLTRGGATVDLVERSETWTMDGAGISIGPASVRALHLLGAYERFLREGAGCDGMDARDASGAHLTTFPTPRLVDPETPGNGAILRPVLGRILVDLALAGGVRARLGTTPVSLRELGGPGTGAAEAGRRGVRVGLSDGTTADYDLVVAADGLSSTTRGELFPAAPAPAYSGQGAWRAVVPRPAEVERTVLWVGGPVKVGVNPISRDEMYLFVNENRAERDRVPEEQWIGRLTEMLAPFADPMLAAARDSLGPDSQVLFRPMDNLIVPLPWHRGRVVLIGDAVHATTPHLAAGAGIGLEDAIALAEELDRAPDIEAALDAFGERRFERCRMVVENSEQLGRLETTPGQEAAYTALQAESLRTLAQAF